ncbi:MAG: hypothetical protein PHI66_05065 [Candidatus Pacebacteria bacterium]|nr:hypothetical protein [Candidatus Paceibacterota bacterium]
MKYTILAKFIGSYMPENKIKIGECIIFKSYKQYDLEDNRTVVPIRSKSSEFHCLEKGVRNYIHYPQRMISTRTFESEYLIRTEVDSYSLWQALEEATNRFNDVSMALSLVAKNVVVKVGAKRIKKARESYDFEISGAFIDEDKEKIRVKLPEPGINVVNFFPRKYPRGFVSKAKDYLSYNDPIFKKGMIYLQRASVMKYSGVFNELDIIINQVKLIEMVAKEIGEKENRFGLNKKEYKKLGTKGVIEKAGSKIKIKRETIEKTRDMWDFRNKGDIAHQNLYYNFYSKNSSNFLINYDVLEKIACEFLTKYYEYMEELKESHKNS